MKYFVMSVKTYTDRHQSIRRQAEKFGLDVEFVFEHDVNTLTPADRARFVEGALPDSTCSLVLKHLRAMELVLQRGLSEAVFLEDDALLFEDFIERLPAIKNNLPRGSDPALIFLGGADNKLDPRFLKASDQNILIESPITTTEAFWTNAEACRQRLDVLETQQIDLPFDHLLQSLDKQLGIIQYRPAVPAATQGSITGVFDTKLDESRGKRPSWFLKLRYLWNRFRRQVLPRWFS